MGKHTKKTNIKTKGCSLEITADRKGVVFTMNQGSVETVLSLKGSGLDLLEDTLVKLETLKDEVRRSPREE